MLRARRVWLVALWLAPLLSEAGALPAAARQPLDETTLGGFDDAVEDGFDDSADRPRDEKPRASPNKRFWDLDGELSLGASYNYLSHFSATGTHYGNLSRLRAQLDLQLDLDLPAGWKSRIEGYGFYDFSYVFKGRGRYTQDVLDDYEWEVDLREVWLQGSPCKDLDLKLGRQIVNWGRSDTVRVLDVINPLDNREPGLVDIEDLRLPLTMARMDYYPGWIPRRWGDWRLQLLVIPEFRSDRTPSVGSDFNPNVIEAPSERPARFFDTPEYGGAITGTFSGWDISFYGARIFLNQALITLPSENSTRRFPRVTMVGAGGNFTFGSWLLKAEMGFFDGTLYNHVDSSGAVPLFSVVEKQRLDTMVGVEYYGVNDLQIAVELVLRHILDHEDALAHAKEDLLETALRISADFFHSRLRVTGVALLLGTLTDVGSIVRLEASYELRDALLLSGGIVLYQEGTSPFFRDIGDNDRLFVRLEYSF